MKKLTFIALVLFCSCNEGNKTNVITRDSLAIEHKSEYADSIANKAKNDADEDLLTRSIKTSPVQITRCYVTKENYGSAIHVEVVNKSGKKIDQMKISWFLYDDSGHEIEHNVHDGTVRELLLQNSTATYSFDLFSAPKTAKAYIFSVRYTDETKWDLPKKLNLDQN